MPVRLSLFSTFFLPSSSIFANAAAFMIYERLLNANSGGAPLSSLLMIYVNLLTFDRI